MNKNKSFSINTAPAAS